MADKYAKKVKLNKSAIIISICTVLVAIGAILFAVFYNAADDISKQYNLDKDHVFKEVKYKDFGKVIGTDKYTFVFFGYPDCESCQNNIGTINDIAKQFDVEVIYYLNSEKLTDDQKKEIESQYKISDLKEDKIQTKYTPQIWVFKDGSLVDLSMKYMKDNKVEDMTYEQVCSRFFQKYLNK